MVRLKEALEMMGGKCPVCGNGDHRNIVVGSKKIVKNLEQMFFFCLDCGNELSRESKKACFAVINNIKIDDEGSKKFRCKIIIKDLGSFIKEEDSGEQETRSVCKVLTAWNIPLIGPLPQTGNE